MIAELEDKPEGSGGLRYSVRADLGFRDVRPRGFNVGKMAAKDSPLLPHIASRIDPFQEFIVPLCADTGATCQI